MSTASNEQQPQAQEKTHFDLHVTGIGYLGRIREIKPRKGDPFWACAVNAMHGEIADPDYTRFDLIIRGDKARQRVLFLKDAVDAKKTVVVAFKAGDIYPEAFEYQDGPRKGEVGVVIKGRLLQLGATKIEGFPVLWDEVGIPDDPAYDLRKTA
jgi:hypothetical protein